MRLIQLEACCRLVLCLVGVTSLISAALADDIPPPEDRAYTRFQQLHDAEQRRGPLKEGVNEDVLNLEAMAGMPDSYSQAIRDFVDAVVTGIKAPPLKRRRFYCKDDYPFSHFPTTSIPVYDRNIVVPLTVLPRPGAVERWSRSPMALKTGWISRDQPFDKSRSLFGETVLFEPGIASKFPLTTPATPYGTALSPGLFVNQTEHLLQSGKTVRSPRFDTELRLMDETESLRIGEKDGATLLGRFRTTLAFPGNSRLRWVKIERGKDVREFLAYVLVDGNGTRRYVENYRMTFVRPLTCSQHQPRLKQHDELLLPTPLPWPPTMYRRLEEEGMHEEWCLDDWFPAQQEACWVIREAEDSKPLQESFLLMPAAEKSDRPVFFIALFAETEPKQLIAELAALYKVSPDTALNSPETMERLNNLYQQIRNFPLSK